MERKLEDEIRNLKRELADKERELELLNDKKLKEDRDRLLGKCFEQHSQGQSRFFIGVTELKKKMNNSYAIEAKEVVDYWTMLIGSYGFSRVMNGSVTINRLDLDNLKEVTREQAYEDIKRILNGISRGYGDK